MELRTNCFAFKLGLTDDLDLFQAGTLGRKDEDGPRSESASVLP